MKRANINRPIFDIMWDLQSQTRKAPMVIRKVGVDSLINFAVDRCSLIQKYDTKWKIHGKVI